MIISLRQLMRLPVYTESGTKLGHVSDLEIDVDTHNVMQYVVRPNAFSAKYYLIKNSQVKDITKDKIIVYDNVLKMLTARNFGTVVTPEEDT